MHKVYGKLILCIYCWSLTAIKSILLRDYTLRDVAKVTVYDCASEQFVSLLLLFDYVHRISKYHLCIESGYQSITSDIYDLIFALIDKL